MYPRIIPEVYELSTNDGIFLVSAHPTTLQMAEYYTKKFKSGISADKIIFKIRPVTVPSANEVMATIL